MSAAKQRAGAEAPAPATPGGHTLQLWEGDRCVSGVDQSVGAGGPHEHLDRVGAIRRGRTGNPRAPRVLSRDRTRFRFGVTEIARLLTSVPKLTTASPVGPGVTVTPPDCPTIDEIEARSVSTQIAFAEPESLPALTAPLAILLSVTAFPAILLSVTAPFLMFLVLTAFLPSFTAAKAVPPTARQSARIATTIAGEGRRRALFPISLSFIGGGVGWTPPCRRRTYPDRPSA